MGLSIFAKKPFRHRDGHMMRVSSLIRGEQIAKHLGAKLNPVAGYEDDICVYVKPHVKPKDDFHFEGWPYLDILDGFDLVHLLKKHHDVPVIACSKHDYDVLSGVVPNRMVIIPQHHCNFERVYKQREEIRVVGVIGTVGALPYIPKEIEEGLEKRSISLVKFTKFFRREDVVDFYQGIDLQLVWRPYKSKMPLANPLKLVNAASFGVPTIALWESAFDEMRGCYIPVLSVDEFFSALDGLIANYSLYCDYSRRGRFRAEDYHIDNIAKRYLML